MTIVLVVYAVMAIVAMVLNGITAGQDVAGAKIAQPNGTFSVNTANLLYAGLAWPGYLTARIVTASAIRKAPMPGKPVYPGGRPLNQ